MSDERPKSFFLSPELHDYLVRHGSPPDAVAGELIAETKRLGALSMMQVAPEEGAFLTVLTRALEARRAIEVGTFTGYSALCIARGLPDDGRL
ncbi:MAG: O-methyltransferase, partial [Deltaproteobacteria bacterium]